MLFPDPVLPEYDLAIHYLTFVRITGVWISLKVHAFDSPQDLHPHGSSIQVAEADWYTIDRSKERIACSRR